MQPKVGHFEAVVVLTGTQEDQVNLDRWKALQRVEQGDALTLRTAVAEACREEAGSIAVPADCS